MAVIKFCTPNKIFKIFVYKLIFFSFCFGKFFDQFLKMNPYSNRSFSSLKDPLFKEMKTGIIQSHVENKKQQLITYFFFFFTFLVYLALTLQPSFNRFFHALYFCVYSQCGTGIQKQSLLCLQYSNVLCIIMYPEKWEILKIITRTKEIVKISFYYTKFV